MVMPTFILKVLLNLPHVQHRSSGESHFRAVHVGTLKHILRLMHVHLLIGTAVKTPRLAVVDMSAYIRTPKEFVNQRLTSHLKLSRPPRPSQLRLTSDEYDTHESDS